LAGAFREYLGLAGLESGKDYLFEYPKAFFWERGNLGIFWGKGVFIIGETQIQVCVSPGEKGFKSFTFRGQQKYSAGGQYTFIL